MARSVWKGPFVDTDVLRKVERVRSSGRKRSDQNLVSTFDDTATVCRAHFRRA